MGKSFYVNCPCCAALLEIDAESGKVLHKWAASERKPDEDIMSSALKKLEIDKKKRADLLEKTQAGLEEQRKKVDDVFKKEVEKVKKEGVKEKPLTPFDLD